MSVQNWQCLSCGEMREGILADLENHKRFFCPNKQVLPVSKTPLMDQIPKTFHDPVNHPPHYKSHPSGIECIEVTRHMSFNIGNAIKYLWRCDHKNGIEDLKKAAWYINDEITKREKQNG